MMAQTVTLDGNTISSSEVMAAVNGDAIIELTEGAWNRIIAARNTIDEILESDETVYGALGLVATWRLYLTWHLH